tara:strand:- start:5158 stop:5730 length:573 start_codon:yes stop_codon:yes gene_type:complete
MKIIKKFFNSKIILFSPTIYRDKRGYFIESYNKQLLKKIGIKDNFIQDNQSFSQKKYTFRGIHLQIKPYAQAKLIRVLTGSVIDYIFDLRLNSKTYGKYESIKLDCKQQKQIFIPEGFGHAFLTLEDNTILQYKVSKKYSAKKSVFLNFNDKKLNINFKKFKKNKIILSYNDKNGISLNEFEKIILKQKK